MSALFATLPESGPTRRRSPVNAVVSVVLHAAAITLAVVATAKAGPDSPSNDEHKIVIWYPPPPPSHPPVTRESRTGGRGASGQRPAVVVPTTDPLPRIPLPAIDPIGPREVVTPLGRIDETWEAGGAERGGGPGGAGEPGSGDVFGDVFTGPQVERVAALRGTAAPRYPATLRERGIEGSVTLRFVVDTTGRVEPASVLVVSSTHDLFAAAARATLPTLRFTPAAAAGGRRVRQLVELPFTFEIR